MRMLYENSGRFVAYIDVQVSCEIRIEVFFLLKATVRGEVLDQEKHFVWVVPYEAIF